MSRVPQWWESMNEGEPMSVATLFGRNLRMDASAGSGDPKAPRGIREESITFVDVDSGETFRLHAEALDDGFALFDLRRMPDRAQR